MIIGADTFLEDFKKNSLLVKTLKDCGKSEIEINETLYDFFKGVIMDLTNELQKQKIPTIHNDAMWKRVVGKHFC